MVDTNSTIRLIYPQWQGGNISKFVTELSPEESSKGYILGSELLNFLSPENSSQKIIKVPISQEYARKSIDGVMDRDIIAKQTKDALDLVSKENPSKIITLGGECSVSVVPFCYLAKKYKDEVCLVWIDAHPDITLPGDVYDGYHAMAVTAIMGEGDKNIVSVLPEKIEPSKILLVGLRDWEREEIKKRQEKFGIKHLGPEETKNDSSKVIEWIKSTGMKKVVVHFDMDVLDPKEIIPAVGVVDNGMKIQEVVRVINDISKEFDIVGMTIAEPMPRIAIKLKNMMSSLPLFK